MYITRVFRVPRPYLENDSDPTEVLMLYSFPLFQVAKNNYI